MTRTAPDLRQRFLQAVPDADESYVIVAGRGGSWLRTLIPGLWGSCERFLGIGEREAVLVKASAGYLRAKGVLWRGPKESIRVRRYLGDRLIRMRFPDSGGRRLQIDGKTNGRKVLHALGLPT